MFTVSLEIAKKLKEAGWIMPTACVWAEGSLLEGETHYLHKNWEPDWSLSKGFYFAPTLGELIRELPNHHLRSPKFLNGLFSVTNWATRFVKQADTPEDACALAWIALKEQKK